MSASIVVITAGLSQPSSSRLLADRLAQATVNALGGLGENAEITVVELRDHAKDLANHFVTGFPAPKLAAVLQQVADADAVIAVSPIFSASYSGLFKMFFDVLELDALKGKPVFLWNMVDLERIKWEGPDALPPGRHTVEFDFKYDGIGAGTLAFNNFSGVGRPGTGTLRVNGNAVATKKMDRTLPMILQWDESFDIGSDTLTGVNDEDYKPPFTFTGKLNKLTVKVDRPQLSPEDIKRLQAAMREKAQSE